MVPATKDHKNLVVDVTVVLKKESNQIQEGVIDRELVNLLLAVRETSSMTKACQQNNVTTRYAQRKLKKFSEGSGIQPLSYHGWQGTKLSEDGQRCISLYATTLGCINRFLKEHGSLDLPPPPVPPSD